MEIAVESLLEQMLRCDIGMAEVGGASSRDGRLGAVRDARRDLARSSSVLGKTELAICVGVGGRKTALVAGLSTGQKKVWKWDRRRGTLLRPAGPPVLMRLRLLITSVLREMGRGRPCSFRKRPQALQRTAPVSSRRQSGVVLVVQFWQTG